MNHNFFEVTSKHYDFRQMESHSNVINTANSLHLFFFLTKLQKKKLRMLIWGVRFCKKQKKLNFTKKLLKFLNVQFIYYLPYLQRYWKLVYVCFGFFLLVSRINGLWYLFVLLMILLKFGYSVFLQQAYTAPTIHSIGFLTVPVSSLRIYLSLGIV